MEKMKVLPCIDCITLGICRAKVTRSKDTIYQATFNFYKIYSRCSLLFDYISERTSITSEFGLLYLNKRHIQEEDIKYTLDYLRIKTNRIDETSGMIL